MAELNERQSNAIKYIDGPLLVLAGAGSGKTRVITQKITYLIQKCHIRANKIFAVTFTNKAAREMNERVRQLVKGREARGLNVSTFHTLGLKMIRRELQHIGLKPGFSIFDDQDSKTLLTELTHKETTLDNDEVKIIRTRISNWKNELIQPATALSRAGNSEEVRAANLYTAYERHLRAYNAVDFDDLILLPTLMLRDHAEIRERWQQRVNYLLVDEYQDTNTSQYLLVKLLVGKRAAFTVVGDDDQSIYAWRGAQPENLVQLHKDYPNLAVVKLEQNYRSSGRILKAANKVIANNPHVFEKKLWSEHGYGEPIRAIRCKNEDDEADRIATAILNQKIQKGRQFKDFAVLYRGNFQPRLLELKLQAYQVPYKISGGTSFFSRTEIKDVMAYLRLLINPDDDNAFLRIVNTPRREIGPGTLEKLGGFAQIKEIGLFNSCLEPELKSVLTPRTRANLQRFSGWVQEVSEQLERGDALATLKQMLRDIDYEQWLVEQSSSPKMAERRMENVWQLLASIERMLVQDEGGHDVETVIGKLVLMDILEQKQEEDDADRVQLMTLHASKGLEFRYVFIMGTEEDILPHRTSIEEGNIEEERRLMYVGVTRAQRELTLTMAAKRKQFGEEFEPSPSRFLDEIPTDDLVWEGRGERKSPQEERALGQAHLANIRGILT